MQRSYKDDIDTENIKKNIAKWYIKNISKYLNPTNKNCKNIGIGTGSTTNFFIKELARAMINKEIAFDKVVASSIGSLQALKKEGINGILYDEQYVKINLYVDGADEVDIQGNLVKGGGGALTGEKILANASDHFVCLVDHNKLVQSIGNFGIPLEILEKASKYVEHFIKHHLPLQFTSHKDIHGETCSCYQKEINIKTLNKISDHGNPILKIIGIKIDPKCVQFWENTLNSIPGVVTSGLFSDNKANTVIVGYKNKIDSLSI